MLRTLLVLSLNAIVAMAGDDDVEFQDTPLLTSLWEATSSKNNDAIDRLLDSSAMGATARASDGRGLAWWAFEYQNPYALGAIIAYGGDILSTDEDLQGQMAVQMCSENSECDKDSLVAKAKSMSEDIKKRKEEREKEREDSDFDVDAGDEESTDDDDEF
uniref:Uncharacterized protein n=1 Tax=Alexandrium andersonii TaxID=327968 RepID=A0A7S2G3Y0_9DINO|mmetsp:Transcript_39423/g.89634  ORF Transcript_39423/g.89634 Transcript_39423/m.89634 type:complete len:160 (+) Transcript_39423:93-572(+)